MDFNEAEEQGEYTLIPANTIAKAALKLKYGEDPTNLYVINSGTSESSWLDCEWTILNGSYAGRKVFDKIGVSGHETFVKMGKTRIRAILEAARNISPKDTSPEAVKARQISSFRELDGLQVNIKIGVRTDKTGQYPPKNCVMLVITPDQLDLDTDIPF
jgi:hypothetical protein